MNLSRHHRGSRGVPQRILLKSLEKKTKGIPGEIEQEIQRAIHEKTEEFPERIWGGIPAGILGEGPV